MNDKITTDVRVHLLLPANLHFAEESSIVESIRLVDTDDFQIALRRADSPQGGLLQKFRREEYDHEADSKYKALITRLERTLIVPQVEIVLKRQIFENEELSVRDNRIIIRGDDPGKSNWFRVTKQVVIMYNSLVNCLFTMFPDEPWKRLEAIGLGPSGPFLYTFDFPQCLQSWKPEFKEMPRGEWVGGFSFALEKKPIEPRYFQGASACISSQQLQVMAKELESLISSKGTLLIGWEYLYLASLHLNRGDVRNAVIALDIAVDYLVKRYIRHGVRIDEITINKICDKLTTGDLLTIAKTLSSSNTEVVIWDTFKKLHDLRNKVLHVHKRRFGGRELELVERAQNDILSLLRGLSVSSVTE